jgi:hypothetical protein
VRRVNPPTPTRQTIGGIIAGVIAHGIPVAAAFITAQVVKRHPGEGFTDIAHVLTALLVAELVVAVAVVVGFFVYVRGPWRRFAVSLVSTWAAIIVVVLTLARFDLP